MYCLDGVELIFFILAHKVLFLIHDENSIYNTPMFAMAIAEQCLQSTESSVSHTTPQRVGCEWANVCERQSWDS